MSGIVSGWKQTKRKTLLPPLHDHIRLAGQLGARDSCGGTLGLVAWLVLATRCQTCPTGLAYIKATLIWQKQGSANEPCLRLGILPAGCLHQGRRRPRRLRQDVQCWRRPTHQGGDADSPGRPQHMVKPYRPRQRPVRAWSCEFYLTWPA